MTIHSEHPFLPDPAGRDRSRRFRGRLSSPVTIVTSGSQENPVGLTVSSLLVIEGDPPALQVVVGPTSDLWYAVETTGRFVLHICLESHRIRADTFAGMRPSPGGPFADVPTRSSEWGPVISDMEDRVYCRVTAREEVGYSGLISAEIDGMDLTEMTAPLVYFRGRYRALATGFV